MTVQVEKEPSRYHPVRFTPRRRVTFLNELRKGKTKRAAAARAGVTHVTIYNWINEDPDFAAKVEEALGEFEASMVDRLQEEVEEGKEGWKAAAWQLERRFPLDYGARSSVKVGGEDGGPVEVKHTIEIGESTQERLGEVVGILASLGKLPALAGGVTIIEHAGSGAGEGADASDDEMGTGEP